MLLIDADYAPYAFGNYPDFDSVIKTEQWLQIIFNHFQTNNYLLFLSGNSNFRYSIATLKPYKDNRKNREKPESYDYIRDFLFKSKKTLIINGAEADDGIAIYNEKYKDEFDVYIVSDDKDFQQLIGNIYKHSNNNLITTQHKIEKKHDITIDLITGDYSSIEYQEYQGKYMLYYQMLIGDSSDNIPGVPGIGSNNSIFKTEFVNGKSLDQIRSIVWREYQLYYKENAVKAYYENYMLLSLIKTNKTVN